LHAHLELIFTLAASFIGALAFGYAALRLGWSPIVGYLLAGVLVGPYTPGLVANKEIADQLAGADEPARDRLMGHLRVGVQWDTEVTLAGDGHTVTQVYCSALPIAYTSIPSPEWEPFARLVLDAAYEATFAVPVSWFIKPDGTVFLKHEGTQTREWFEQQARALF